MFEVNKDPPEIFVVLFDAMVQFFDVPPVQETKNLLLKLPAPLTGDDFDQGNLLFERFFHDQVQFCVDLITLVVDVVQIQF